MLPRGRLGVLRLPGARIRAALLMTLLAVVSFVLAGAKSARADWNDDYPYSGGAIGAKDPWGFSTRECTSFVAFRLINRNGDTGFHGPIGYGAQDWGTVYASITNHNPAPGSVAWWSSGHVAWVESVSGSNVTIEEYIGTTTTTSTSARSRPVTQLASSTSRIYRPAHHLLRTLTIRNFGRRHICRGLHR